MVTPGTISNTRMSNLQKIGLCIIPPRLRLERKSWVYGPLKLYHLGNGVGKAVKKPLKKAAI